MTLTFLKQIAKALSVQFGSDCEIVIHDLTRKSIGKSIIYIENGHITNRQIGDGPSQIVIETLKKDPSKVHDQLGYLTRTDGGKTLKSSTIFVRESEDGPVQYIFGINYDITRFLYFQDAIRALITESTDSAVNPSYHQEPTRIQTNVEDILDELILQSVSIIGKPVSLMTKEEKIEAIQFLNSSGAFLITRAGDKVSQYFGISKYTLYNYIKADQQ